MSRKRDDNASKLSETSAIRTSRKKEKGLLSSQEQKKPEKKEKKKHTELGGKDEGGNFPSHRGTMRDEKKGVYKPILAI